MKWLVIVSLVLLAGCGNAIEPRVNTTPELPNGRTMVGVDTFYPKDSNTLSSVVNDFYDKAAKSSMEGRARAIIVPHSIYPYSGQVTADAFSQLDKDYKRFIILTSVSGFKGIAIPTKEDYVTPLGTVKVQDMQITYQPAKDEIANIEIQLPFIQTRYENFRVIPIIVGEVTLTELNELSSAIVEQMDNETALVIVTELTQNQPYLKVYKSDLGCLNAISKIDINKIINDCQATSRTALLAGMQVVKQMGLEADAIKYTTSGDSSGNKEKVSGYAGYAFRE